MLIELRREPSGSREMIERNVLSAATAVVFAFVLACSSEPGANNIDATVLDTSGSDAEQPDLSSPNGDADMTSADETGTGDQGDAETGEDPEDQETDTGEPVRLRCVGRVVESYDVGTDTWTEQTVCERDERCVDGACVDLPNGFGDECDDSAGCADDELDCVDGHCTTRPLSEAGGDCLGDEECVDDMVCTRRGACQAGAEDDPCMDNGDCAEANYCGPDDTCISRLGLGEECGPEVECLSGNCSNGHCAPEGFSYIPAGTFCMGAPGYGGSEECPDRDPELGVENYEGPMHEVTLTRPFFLQQNEVTQNQWDEHFDTNPSFFHDCGGNCPVDSVNWFEALAYLNDLSEAQGLDPCYTFTECEEIAVGEGWYCLQPPQITDDGNVYECPGYRLPTEAEWEWAYRAGTTTATYNGDLTYVDEDPLDPALDPIAWYGGNSTVSYSSGARCDMDHPEPLCGTQPVGEKMANDWGLYGMAGNVLEWVWDSFEEYTEVALEDPIEVRGTFWYDAVTRGGHWNSSAMTCRAAHRERFRVHSGSHIRGFRVARTVPTD